MQKSKLNVESEVDILRQGMFLLPPPIQHTSLPGFDPNIAQAEATFKVLYDSKNQKLTKIGAKFCKEMKISEEMIVPKGKDKFEAEYDDKEIAHLHYKHFVNRRQKCLLRLTHRMQDFANESIESSSPQKSPTSHIFNRTSNS